jgi:hypothetical protein
MITKELLAQAMSYAEYEKLLEDLLAHGKTTGPNQSEEYVGYAKINLQRMHRIKKTITLTPELRDALSGLKESYIWLIITEGWCGDASQNLPIFNVIENGFPAIELKLILRDEHPDIMNLYLTNSTRSIPKLICLQKNTETITEIFNWGPRPLALQDIVLNLKSRGVSKAEKGLIVQQWYNADKTLSAQKEILNLVRDLH